MSPLRQNVPGRLALPETITVLLISSDNDDHTRLRQLLSGAEWTIQSCHNVAEAERYLGISGDSIVVCERRLPDGDWGSVLDKLHEVRDPPALLVACRHADERFWAEVLNRGGYDVLLKPFETGEVMRICRMASRCKPALRH